MDCVRVLADPFIYCFGVSKNITHNVFSPSSGTMLLRKCGFK